MRRNIFLVGLLIILMSGIVIADFYPYGNINLLGVYNITNASYMCIGSDCIDSWDFDTNETTRVEALWGENTTIHERIDDINTTDALDWDEIGDVPTNTPTDGDSANLSTSNQIYDFVIGLGYSTITYVNTQISSIGNWTADKSEYWNSSTDLDTVIDTDEITELKIDFNTACAAGSHLYVLGNNLACESDDDTTYTAGNSLYLDGTEFNVNDTDINASIEAYGYSTATGTVTSIATTAPISGGTITGTGTISLETATPSDGDTTHASTADQIYDWVIGLSYSSFGASVDDTEMTAEDFGEFTCTGDEDGCTLNTGSFDDEYIELEDTFVGDVTGTYGATVVGDDTHNHSYTTMTPMTEANLYTILSDVTRFYEAGDKVGDADTLDTHDSSYFQIDLTDEASLYTALSDVTEFIETNDAATLVTLNTGQGANELYDMNQDVKSTDNVQFQKVTVERIIFENDITNHYISDNATSLILCGDTSCFFIH